MNGGVHVRAGVAVMFRVPPRIHFSFLNEVEVQLLAGFSDYAIVVRIALIQQPVDRENMVLRFPNERNGFPLGVFGLSSITVPNLDVFHRWINKTFSPLPFALGSLHLFVPNKVGLSCEAALWPR